MPKRCYKCMMEVDVNDLLCPHCGYDFENGENSYGLLQVGTVLRDRYTIGASLGQGGFGVTYRAWDEMLSRIVAIKEYFPISNGMVNRNPGESMVIVYEGAKEEEFKRGKQRFLEEARNMAKFNEHPNIVHIHDFFEENNTAYIVMEFLNGISFKEYIKRSKGKVELAVALGVIHFLLNALKELHKAGYIHRDVSPDNVFICEKGIIKLIDFGATRFSAGEKERQFSIVIKPGYSPPEQYRSNAKQGAWTDIYAVGAMFYYSILGIKADESTNRVIMDKVVAPHLIDSSIPVSISNAIMRAIALKPELRFQNTESFREALQSKKPVRDAKQELRRRRVFRFAVITLIFLILVGGTLATYQTYQVRAKGIDLEPAEISIWLPKENSGNLQWSDMSEEENDAGLSEGFNRIYPQIEVETVWIPKEEYAKKLEEAAKNNSLPVVFDKSYLKKEDSYQYLAKQDLLLKLLDESMDEYYFSEQYLPWIDEKLCVPISFKLPVVYVNRLLITDKSSLISNPDEFLLLTKKEYAMAEEDLRLYQSILPEIEKGHDYADFIFSDAANSDAENYDPDEEREQTLKGKVTYLISDTDSYKKVQEDMAGRYDLMFFENLEIYGEFTHALAVNAAAEEAQRRAGEMFLYYMISEEGQIIWNIRYNEGLPIHKNVMEEYKNLNPEMEELEKTLQSMKGVLSE